MQQVMVERRVGREDRCHLVVVRRVYVLVDAVPRELHLPGQGRVSHIVGFSRAVQGAQADQGC